MGKRLIAATLLPLSVAAMLAGCKLVSKPGDQQGAPTASASATPTPSATATPTTSVNWVPDAPNPSVNLALDPLPTQPGDVPDSHDVAFLKRFKGAAIIGYVSRPYDKLTFYDANESADPGPHTLPVEGPVTRIVYRIPVGHSALEVLRNYEDLAKAAGLAQTSEHACKSSYGGIASAMWQQLPTGKLDNPAYIGGTQSDFEYPRCYFSARGMAGGKPLMLGVYVAEKHKFMNQTGFDGKPLVWQDGEVAVIVDLVAAKPVADQMVTVKAADMADALASKGFIDLYGIYFDTDQTAIKPDSDATLGEIASLLKIDRSLKLEVSGHTDNSGNAPHNLALSQGRAQAVVAALTGKYGIDARRLVAKGYGSTKPVAPNSDAAGMAKNRRVELRKM